MKAVQRKKYSVSTAGMPQRLLKKENKMLQGEEDGTYLYSLGMSAHTRGSAAMFGAHR